MPQTRPGDHSAEAARSDAPEDRFVDRLVAEELDWRRWVLRYPKTSLVLAAAGGLVLGRLRGREIVSSLGEYAADTVTEGINEYLGRDVV